jgi:hypothetical protein
MNGHSYIDVAGRLSPRDRLGTPIDRGVCSGYWRPRKEATMDSVQFVRRTSEEYRRRFGSLEVEKLDFLKMALHTAYDLGYQHAKDGAKVRTRPVIPPEKWPRT